MSVLVAWAFIVRGYAVEAVALARNQVRPGIRGFAAEAGQDMIEYALVIGVVAIGIVLLFLITPIGPAFAELVNRVACLTSGGTWASAGTGSCT